MNPSTEDGLQRETARTLAWSVAEKHRSGTSLRVTGPDLVLCPVSVRVSGSYKARGIGVGDLEAGHHEALCEV